ncbi:50S ribosomal protein L5 [Candidatus Falkowbacteria bacterium CG_4_9_14_3_um_filter_38_19]|uniref:Large ribosomal subunit protein uL5 n=2 Tax=Candidatus Falkowiibacteriota TaxID=1752728 RepID=A0A2M8AES8_9BACT|nr:50S ribosomal protein L5 [Candidatus Falkowbacteria bacterium]PJB16025.1 MAG: 50S ribosomal protein L5 [Candidatus Falkowbacteria bacterium CG_4_9_14_3_um_filter_38_19]
MRLKELYKKEIVPKMKEKFGYTNILAVPRLSKVVINVGVGRSSKEKAFIDNVVSSLSRISGQKPVLTKAKKSISAFKIRQGMIVGVMVTLRNKRMDDFVQKLVQITFPRIRDFRGISQKQVDRQGNLTVGLREHLAFGEIKADEVDSIHGAEISISTTAKTRQEGLELFKLLGFPFKHE